MFPAITLLRLRLLHSILLACTAVCMGAVAPHDEAVTVSFAAAKGTMTFHEPLQIEFSVNNGTGQGILLDLGYHQENNFEFVVTTPDGSTVRVPRIVRGGLSRGGTRSLPPWEEFKQQLLFNKWYEFPRPGDYRVEARFVGSIQAQSGMPVKTRSSNLLTIYVGPRDPERLAEVCQELATNAFKNNSRIAREAASALSYVKDPVAVPYLARVLKESFWGKEAAIEGLARIGNAEAVGVLTSNLNMQDPELRTRIENTLRGMKAGRNK